MNGNGIMKFVLLNIVNEDEFVKEVVNQMPAVCGARFEFIDMDDCLFVDDNETSIREAKDFLKRNHIRFVVE